MKSLICEKKKFSYQYFFIPLYNNNTYKVGRYFLEKPVVYYKEKHITSIKIYRYN